ncbi:MAG: riboflavin synthase, partial [Candidatus Thermoplasmatota archaeon]|nr:riboflavin synthase [Candidatus Thermoplasmatota archaeon]
MKLIGIADTTFARYDMAKSIVDELNSTGTGFRVSRYTVPGIKDLPVASLMLFNSGCDIVIACGMPGKKPVDKWKLNEY